jgi:hypothetical protein
MNYRFKNTYDIKLNIKLGIINIIIMSCNKNQQ